MRKILSFTLALIILSSMFALGEKRTMSKEESAPKPELVDIKADVVYPHKMGPDSTVLCLVGNFAAQHNGAVITADSAVRYGDERFDCFGNVLINKNTTYAYADRAVYNSAVNTITLYSPIIKVVDEDVTLYTYHFEFNTLDNIGKYWRGGVITNKDSSRLESRSGYYYSDLKELVGVGDVEIFTPNYELSGDSVRYNMATDYAQFFKNTNIWSKSGEYLYTDEGNYDKESDKFSFVRNGYMLSSEREAWSDSLDYYQGVDETILRNNIQVDDTTNKVLAYSDFAHHWGAEEKLFLSRNPQIVNYDPEQVDTLFMRGDTIILTTHNSNIEQLPSTPPPVPAPVDEPTTEVAPQTAQTPQTASAPQQSQPAQPATPPTSRPQKTSSASERRAERIERAKESVEESAEEDEPQPALEEEPSSVPDLADSVAVDSLASDTLPPLTAKELKAQAKDSVRKIKAEEKRLKAEEKRKRAEEISKERIRKRAEKIDAQKARAARAAAKRKARINARRIRRGKTTAAEIAAADSLDSLRVADSLGVLDSLKLADSLAALPPVDTTQTAVEEVKRDSIYRIVMAYRNTKTLQGGQQSVSDSLVVDSRDSTLHLYINPYVWNGLNQISSEVMDIYSANGEIQKAVFTGSPIMSSKIDTTYYNQVAGKTITSLFENNELVRNDVDNNVQTIYFARDEDTGEVTTMVYVESGSASFFIKNQDLEGITYRIQPTYTFYPVDLIPESQPMRLEGFEWKGDLRPSRRDFGDRKQRPSIRKAKESLPRPDFPIESAMRIDMELYQKNRRWIDRDDVVTTQVEEWLESLGFKSGQPRSQPLK